MAKRLARWTLGWLCMWSTLVRLCTPIGLRVGMWCLRRSVPAVPITFNEKVRHKMAFDRRPMLTTFADKVGVRGYVADVVGEAYLNDLLVVAEDPAEIDWGSLPEEFVCKVSHGCGGNILVDRRVALDVELPVRIGAMDWGGFRVHPDRFDVGRASSILETWLGTSYAWYPGRRFTEWAYRGVQPRVLIEPLLSDPDGGPPVDYLLYVFDGQCRLINRDRYDMTTGVTTGDLMTPAWERLDVVKNGYPCSADPPPAPGNLERMIEVAEALAAPVDFVRVDLYEVDGRVVFGEMTNYPTGGFNVFEPGEWDRVVGEWWRLDGVSIVG